MAKIKHFYQCASPCIAVTITGKEGEKEMEGKIAKLEANVDNITGNISDVKMDVREIRRDIGKLDTSLRSEMKTDFRLMFAALITSVLGLAALMAKGFYWF